MKLSRENAAAWAAVALIVTAGAVGLWPDIANGRADLNDNVAHYSIVQRIVQAVERGENPLDHWSPEWSFGYPVIRTYQPLAHLMAAAIYFCLGKTVALATVFAWFRFVTVALLPLSFFVAARRLELPRTTAVAAALLAPMISTNGLFGLEYGSFVWAGSGLFPQAAAAHTLLLAIGFGWRAIRFGRGMALAGAMVGLTLLAQMVYGYMAAMTLCLAAMMPCADAPWRTRLRRLMWTGLTAAVLFAFQLAPLLADRATFNRSRWEPAWKFDALGLWATIERLATGGLLDHGRLPVLSLLALAGAALYVWSRRRGEAEAAHGFALACAALWIAMLFGRPFWGPALSLIGAVEEMHLHRVSGGAQVFLVLLAAIALSRMWRELAARRLALGAVAATAALLYPMASERARYVESNRDFGARNLAAWRAERQSIESAIAMTRERRGRAFAGLAAGWGQQLKVGHVPFYAFLSTSGVPALSFLYHSMALTGDVMVHFNEWDAAQYRLFNIRTVIARNDPSWRMPPHLFPRGEFGNYRLYAAPGIGYFDVVDVTAAVATSRRSFYDINYRWLESDWMAKRVHLLLDMDGSAPSAMPRVAPEAALPTAAAMAPAGEIASQARDGEVYRAELDAARPGYALFRMTYHRRWKAWVDGVEQPVAMLSPGFMGVAVGAGRHAVEFRYVPEWWRTWLALLSLGGVLALAVAERRGGLAWVEARVGRYVAGVGSASAVAPVVRNWAAAIAMALPLCVPLMTGAVIAGYDAFSHVPRIVEVHQNVIHGIVLPRWAPDLGGGNGQPLFLFHPPLFYWMAEALGLVGAPLGLAINVSCALLVLAAAATMFLLARLYFGNLGGTLAAAAYLYAPYLATNLYVRAAWPELAAQALMPLAMYGFAAYARGLGRGRLIAGAAAYAGVAFSHEASALLFTPLLVAWVAYQAWTAGSRWRMVELAAGWAAGAGLSACIWLPSALERQYVALERASEGALRYSNHFLSLARLVYWSWTPGSPVVNANDPVPLTVGWGHVLVATVALVWMGRHPDAGLRRLARFLAASGFALGLLSTEWTRPLWDASGLLQAAQFPWRLLGPVALCAALLAGALGPLLEGLGARRWMAIGAAFALLLLPNLGRLKPPALRDIDESFWTPRELARTGFETTSRREMTPRWMLYQPPLREPPAQVATGVAAIRTTSRTPFHWTGAVEAQSAALIDMSIAYFPGWTVRVDGKAVEASAAHGTGVIRFGVPAGTHDVEVRWENTPARLAGNAISLATLALLVWFWRRGRSPSGGKTRAAPEAPAASAPPPE